MKVVEGQLTLDVIATVMRTPKFWYKENYPGRELEDAFREFRVLLEQEASDPQNIAYLQQYKRRIESEPLPTGRVFRRRRFDKTSKGKPAQADAAYSGIEQKLGEPVEYDPRDVESIEDVEVLRL